MTDFLILTEKKYLNPSKSDPYIQNIFLEYQLLKDCLNQKGYTVERSNWDNPNIDFSQNKAIVFRTIWDYFSRFDEFFDWLESNSIKSKFINPKKIVDWNIHKFYLKELEEKGFPIVPTYFVTRRSSITLREILKKTSWESIVIKPAISGSAYLTYKIDAQNIEQNENLFSQLIAERDMLVQEYQTTITSKGEASLIVLNGNYTHAIRKKAKQGDFRVQDDFGGTVESYTPTPKEITMAEKVFSILNPIPAYGRVDIIWDKNNLFYISELELIEPELWIRFHKKAVEEFANGLIRFLEEV